MSTGKGCCVLFSGYPLLRMEELVICFRANFIHDRGLHGRARIAFEGSKAVRVLVVDGPQLPRWESSGSGSSVGTAESPLAQRTGLQEPNCAA